jgi:hypothetical protein
MIFFLISKPTNYNPGKLLPPELKIVCSVYSDTNDKPIKDTVPDNRVCLLAWNEVTFMNTHKNPAITIKINTIADLRAAVFYVASRDEVCKDMAKQFMARYGINLLPVNPAVLTPEAESIITAVFRDYAHPCIGNLRISPVIRPQTTDDQYIKNWNDFPGKYMTNFTKSLIKDTINDLPKVGLAELEKSGRDQVKICKDMTTLARAMFGEMTTYVTKKLEKIFALKLCLSESLIIHQKQLIHDMLFTSLPDTGAQPIKYYPFYDWCNYQFNNYLDNGYWIQSDLQGKNMWNCLEYLPFYIPSGAVKFNATNEPKDKDPENTLFWFLYINLLFDFVENTAERELLKCKMTIKTPNQEEITLIKNTLWNKFPMCIRGAMIINSLRRLNCLTVVDFNRGKAIMSKIPITGSSDYYVECIPTDHYPESGNAKEVPDMIIGGSKKMRPWNFNRPEDDPVVKTYRHFLMPLWGGSSGHTRGNIESAAQIMNKYTFNLTAVSTRPKLSFVPCITTSLFVFWRLYFDKRISGVHTLTETFEAGFSLHQHGSMTILREVNPAITLKITSSDIISTHIDIPEEANEDIFEYMINNWVHNKAGSGIPNAIYILNFIHRFFWRDNIAGIDKIINDLKAEITSKNFEVPMWSKPIIKYNSPSLSIAATSDVLGGTVLRSFDKLNVNKYPPLPPQSKPTENKDPSDRLRSLYDKLSKLSGKYSFTDDFINLPKCLCNNEYVPFLSEFVFDKISAGELSAESFTFTAEYSLNDTAFLKMLGTVIGVKNAGDISCTVYDNDDGFYFSCYIVCGGSFKISDTLTLEMNGVTLESCFEGESRSPSAAILSDIKKDDINIEITADFMFANYALELAGESKGGVLTLDKLFRLFGGSFPIDIPSSMNIGLKNLSMTVLTDTMSIPSLSLTIAAEDTISVWGDKITFKPYAEIELSFPFDSDLRQTDYTLSGKFMVGSNSIYIAYYSNKSAAIKLDDNTPLVISEILEFFNIKANIPLEISDFSADLYFGDEFSMNLYLTVSEVLKITAGKAEFSIDEISLYTALYAGKLEDLKLSGQFNISGFTLDVKGEIDGDKNYSISAFCLAPVNLIDFAERIADTFGQPFDEETLPENFRSIILSNFTVSYNSGDRIFSAAVDLDFSEGEAPALTDSFSINEIAFSITAKAGENAEFSFIAGVTICKVAVDLNIARKGGNFTIDGNADFGGIKIAEIAADIGVDTDELPDFITDFAIDKLSLSYNLTTKAWAITLETSAGTVKLQKEINGTDILWTFDFKTPTSFSADLLSLPLLGETVRKIAPETANLTVGDFEIKYMTTDGLLFLCKAFGENRTIVLYKKDSEKAILNTTNAATPSTVHWFKVEKSFSVLTIEKVALGLDGSKAVFLIDANLAVSPLTFSLLGAGFGVGMTMPLDVSFYLSGFGISFDNGSIAIAGSFSHTENAGKESYSGMISVKYKTIAISAVAEYEEGSFFAYGALLASIGGPPAFFVTGLSLGFGYNKSLALPPIEKVAEYPLITAATGGFTAETLTDLKTYITDSPKENFITAGVKFNSFKMVNGFLLLIVSFGKEFELGLLGTAEATVPPNCGETNPIARAVLEIKADLRPAEGVFTLEAMLAPDSFILSKDCKLTGGFAAYFWFADNPHSGDFVITLGGYHPAYQPPAHYPVVPRLGLLWNVSDNITISGEIYFALTPSTVMAGGKLSAVYQSGNLRAWFTAYADFLLSWKPFRYDISIGVSVGASYRVDWWFIHHTFSIELGADLHIWGPEAMGTVHISWFIISFTVSFGDSSKCHQEEVLSWEDFKNSFLVDSSANSADSEILSLSIGGITVQASDGIDIADPKNLSFLCVSKIPESGNVRPSGGKEISAETVVTVKNSDGTDVTAAFIKSDEKKNLPAAMWKAASGNPLTEEAVIKDVVCGQNLSVNTPLVTLFPKICVISLDELYKENILNYDHCFLFKKVSDMKLSDESSLEVFSNNEKNISTVRAKFLADNGITEAVSMAILAGNADSYFAEEFLTER